MSEGKNRDWLAADGSHPSRPACDVKRIPGGHPLKIRLASGAGDGLRCPACGNSHHQVTDSRHAMGATRRTRWCRCGHRFKTREIIFEDGSALEAAALIASLSSERREMFMALLRELTEAA